MLHNPLPPSTRFQGAPCPNCGGATLCPSPQRLTKLIELTEEEEATFVALWEAAGAPWVDFKASHEEIAHEIFRYDPDGGPEPSTAAPKIKAAIVGLNRKLGRLAWIESQYKGQSAGKQIERGFTLRITQDPATPTLYRVPLRGKSGGLSRRYNPVTCTSCGRSIYNPPAEMVWHAAGLQPQERKIMRAIMDSPNQVASTARIVELVYGDLSRENAFKTALCNLRKRLREANSGMAVRSGCYGGEYYIVSEVGA